MDPRAYRIAQEFVRAQVRRARYAPEFLQWVGGRRFPNPNPEGRKQDVVFDTLPDDEQVRIYESWRTKNNVQEDTPRAPKPESREETTARNIDIVRNGRETARRLLSSGGGGVGPANESYIVTLEHDGDTQEFIYKPAKGESQGLRVGIPAGQYHSREQAAYSIDAMLGGQGVVPVTHTRGKESGSYQLWAKGARAMHGKDLEDVVEKVSLQELTSNPGFERLNVMDLLMGNEDRHRGNLLYYFDGDETSENLRFVAIDNGLSMASPSTEANSRVYVNPFEAWYQVPGMEAVMDASPEDRKDPNFLRNLQQKKAEEAMMAGTKAVAKTLSRISPEMHDQIKGLNLSKVAKSMSSAGIDEEGAVRATLVRIAALQADPTIFRDMLKRQGEDLEFAWQDFQYLSGWKDDLLWRAGADKDVEKKIDAAMKDARPRGGWAPAPELEDEEQVMKELAKWGGVDPNAGTAPAGAPADTAKAGPPSTKAWLENIKDSGTRQAMAHIAEHGEISEDELTKMLGGARKARKFARNFDKIMKTAPFELEQVQTSKGKIYRKRDTSREQVSQLKYNEHGFAIRASVRDRWLSSFIKCARGRKLTISEVNPRDRKPRVVGIFELEHNGKIKESYKDPRFRNDIRRGIRLMGKRFVPKDGATFMAVLEKVYGARSLYDVKRT